MNLNSKIEVTKETVSVSLSFAGYLLVRPSVCPVFYGEYFENEENIEKGR